MTSKVLKNDDDRPIIEKTVKTFSAPPLADKGGVPSLSKMREKFKKDLTIRDSHFRISELSSKQLTVEEEERQLFQDRVDKEVKERIEKLTAEVTSKAHQEGLEKGRAEGYEAEVKRLAEMYKGAQKVFSDLAGLTTQIFQAHEAAVMDFIGHIVEVVVRHEIQMDRGYLSRILKEIVERTGAKENIKIRLGKEDMKVVEEIQKRLIDQVGQLRSLTFETDEAFQAGDCAVETNYGEIRALLQQEIEIIKKELAAKVPGGVSVRD
jgi:flagellar biosynthesis/type III secretory pathway protein FliH